MIINTYFTLLVGVLAEILVALGLIYFIHTSGHTPLDRNGKFSKKNAVLLVVLFSIAGLVTSRFFTFSWDDARININDGVALLAGMFGGPISGLGSGIVIGIDRFAIGGPGSLACSISPIAAGIIGSIVWYFSAKQFPKTIVAILALVLVEIVHLVLLLSLGAGTDDIFKTLRDVSFVQLVFNLLSMIVFAFVYNYYIRVLPIDNPDWD